MATQAKDLTMASPERPALVINGSIRWPDNSPVVGVRVRAFSKDLRHEQLLGEATTDDEGRYEITYAPTQLRPAIEVRVIDIKEPALLLAESDVIYNAKPVKVVDLTIDREYSEYEHLQAALEPLRDGVRVANLTEKDIAFLHTGTGIESERIEALVTATRLGKDIKLPPEALYGLFREGMPSTRSDLLERDTETLRKALDSAIRKHIVPRRLADDVDRILERLDQLREEDPRTQRKKRQKEVRRLGKAAALDEKKMPAVLEKIASPAMMSDTTLGELVESRVLEEEEAVRLGLVSSLDALCDQDSTLTAAVLDAEIPKLPRGRVHRREDLAVLDRADWLSVLERSQTEPPEGWSRERHAALMAKKIELLHPSRTLWARMTERASDDLAANIARLQPLCRRNASVLRARRFDDLNVTDDDGNQLRETHTRMRRLVNRYPGLKLGEILDDPDLDEQEKLTRVTSRTALLTRFEQQNPGADFLRFDYGPGSPDLAQLDFAGFDDDEKRMVLRTVKAWRRIHGITRDSEHTRLLAELGHHSPLSMTRQSLGGLIEETCLDAKTAERYYRRACNQTNQIETATAALVDAARDSRLGLPRSGTLPSIEIPGIEEYLCQLDGWEAFFGNLSYCRCRPCQSIFGPVAYFVDLMRFVEKYTSTQFEGRRNHVLYLENRRPDLWKLPLTCEHTDELLPYLDVINEVLENYIAQRLGLLAEDVPAPGEDRAVVERRVYEHFHDSADSFGQPFSLAQTRLDLYLQHFDLTRGDVASLLDAEPDVVAATVLGLSRADGDGDDRREFELITQVDENHLDRVYSLDFSGSPVTFTDPHLDSADAASRNDVQLLVEAMGLTRDELGSLVQTAFVQQLESDFLSEERIEIQSEKRFPETREDDDGPVSIQNDIERIHGLTLGNLDRMHRMTRLWRHLPWTFEELDLVLGALRGPAIAIFLNKEILHGIASLLTIQQRFALSVEELCALSGPLPQQPAGDQQQPFFDQLFNHPDFVRLDGLYPKKDTPFLHPGLRRTPLEASEVGYDLPRLSSGLQVDDGVLLELIRHLAEPLDLDLDPEGSESARSFKLTASNLSLLYRHARLTGLLKLSVSELFALIGCLAGASGAPRTHIASLGQLRSLLELYDWWRSTRYSLDDLAFITGRPVKEPGSYPDAEALAGDLWRTVRAEGSLIFTETVFAFLEGVSEQQSRDIIAANRSTFFSAALGPRYRLVGTAADLDIDDASLPEGVEAKDLREHLATYGELMAAGAEAPPDAVFDDTVFTAKGLGEDQSRALVLVNPEVIAAVALEGSYWLADDFDLGADRLTIPAGIPVAEEDARALLRRYHPVEIIPNLLAARLGTSPDKLQVLIAMTGAKLDDRFMAALKGREPSPELVALVDDLLPLSVAFRGEAFDAATLRWIAGHHEALFEITDLGAISLQGLRRIEQYRVLAEDGGEPERAERLRRSLPEFAGDWRGWDRQALASILEVETGVAQTLLDELGGNGFLPANALEAVDKLRRCARLTHRLGVGGEVLPQIVAPDHQKLSRAANAIFGAFRAKYRDEEAWQAKLEPYQDKIRGRKRDALSDYLLHSHEPRAFRNTNDLYHHFLIDVELEGCARTSRLVAAISSVQLYVHRLLMNLEQDRGQGSERLVVTLGRGEEAEIAKQEWEWRKSYRVWEANRKVFLYPENYIEPDLRDNKTPLFEELESTLLQQEVNEQTVLDAYVAYLRGFEEVSRLKIAGAYHDKQGVDADILHLFGVTADEPRTYYYRTVENLCAGEQEDSAGESPTVWNPWRKIDVQIPVEKVSPIVFRKKLYVFWVDITTRPKNSELDGGSSNFVGYNHKMSLKYVSLRLDNTWTSPQQVRLNQSPLTGDGVLYEGVREEGVFAFRVHEENEYKYAVYPPYGSTEAEHIATIGDKEIVESLRQLYPLTQSEEVEAASFAAVKESFDSTPNDQNLINDHVRRTCKLSPLDDYTLSGPRWGRIYPAKGVDPESGKDNELVVVGVDFEMVSRPSLSMGHVGSRIPYGDVPSEPGVSKFLLYVREALEIYVFLVPEGSGRSYPYSCRASCRATEDSVAHSGLILGPIGRLDEDCDFELVSGSIEDAIVGVCGDTLLLQGSATNDGSFLVRRIGSPLGETFKDRLFTNRVDGLLSTLFQNEELRESAASLRVLDEERVKGMPEEGERVDFQGAYGPYYREIFFHIPFLIANHLNSQGKYEEAHKWYSYIFDPTATENGDGDGDGDGNEVDPTIRSWRYIEFRKHDFATMKDLLVGERGALARNRYRNDPFNPHAIARGRLNAYRKAVVMKVIDNLLDWGDALFAQDTMESINEATLLYVTAADILGDRPADVGECGVATAVSYEDLPALDADIDEETEESNEFLMEVGHVVEPTASHGWSPLSRVIYCSPGSISERSASQRARDHMLGQPTPPSSPESTRGRVVENLGEGLFRVENPRSTTSGGLGVLLTAYQLTLAPAFCVPANKTLLGYWDRVEDRLFKIRNCMNLSGVRRQLALFAPEIDPMLLVRAKAAGLSLEEVLNAFSGDLPPYRFAYLIERAKGYAAVLQGFGSALLSALEKKDVEELNQMRAGHQKNILNLSRQLRHDEYNVAVATYESLVRRKETLLYRKSYYGGLIDQGLIPSESLQVAARGSAAIYTAIAAGLEVGAASVFLAPRVGSPFAMVYGGKELGDSLDAFAKATSAMADIANEAASLAGMIAGFERRKEGWEHQKDLAKRELQEITKQLVAAEIRKDMAKRSIDVFEKNVEQGDEVYDFYQDKLTSLGLYTWLSTKLKMLYGEAYKNAYTMARLAEQAYRFERGDDASEMIGNHWTASKAGLLAGESLLIDLQNLERRFLETNYRGLEIDQAFSLTQVDPAALIRLKETGECDFVIPELFFNLFYPGHYRRKIKAVRLTIPCITGPYTNVSATLALRGSRLRKEPDQDLVEVPKTRSVTIATSTAQNDAGVFELNFRDERYMPFEGAGAVSDWRLELPRTFRPFDYSTINDVILHISYTAEHDDALRNAVEIGLGEVEAKLLTTLKDSESSLVRVISLRQELSHELNSLIHSPQNTEVKVKIEEKHFPFFLQGKDRTLRLDKAELIVRTAKDQDIGDLTISVDARSLTEFNTDDFGGLPASDIIDLEGGIVATHTLKVTNPGALAPDPRQPGDLSAIDPEKLTDIYLYFEYGIE